MSIKNTILVNGKRKVCRIYDTGPDGAFDRYTVAFKGANVRGRAGAIYHLQGKPGFKVEFSTVKAETKGLEFAA